MHGLSPAALVASLGYLAIFLLSVAQSCCVPTSSELTLGVAGALAFERKLNLEGAIASGVAGEVIGAYIAWYIGRVGGRRLVARYGRFVLLRPSDLDRAEAWYARHGRLGVFGGRLLPVVRNFVALPAGVAEVPALPFGVLTFLGSLVWDSAMALIGYGLGSSYHAVLKGVSDAGYLVAAVVVLVVAAAVYHRWRSFQRHAPAAEAAGDGRTAATVVGGRTTTGPATPGVTRTATGSGSVRLVPAHPRPVAAENRLSPLGGAATPAAPDGETGPGR